MGDVSIGVLSYRDGHWQGEEGGSDLSSTELSMGRLRALPVCSSPCPWAAPTPSPEHLESHSQRARVQHISSAPGRPQTPDPKAGRELSLSRQRSQESWGCHSSQGLTSVTLMRPFLVSHVPAVTVFSSMVGGGTGHTNHGAYFWNWFLL